MQMCDYSIQKLIYNSPGWTIHLETSALSEAAIAEIRIEIAVVGLSFIEAKIKRGAN